MLACNKESPWDGMREQRKEVLTNASPGIVHYPHPRPRRRLVSAIAPTADCARLKQKGSYHHDLRQEHWPGQAPQGARKRKWDLLHWQVVAHGGSIGH
tara:strand:- start:5067 stop:5360 length:294 start_codon:yes stop_codon:yes gene_type:complete